jgi:NitT/TauT family transport system substrate-binding protein
MPASRFGAAPKNRRGAYAIVVATLLGVSPVAAAEPTPLKLGISEPVNTVLAMWMADAAGFYGAQGLKVEIINMNGGSRGAKELAAGRIDVMHVGLSSVVRLNQTGAELRVIASVSNIIRFTFFSAPTVRTAAELKGGVVGVSAFGSESDATVTLALKRLSLSRDDVILKEYGGGTRRIAALKSGEIKATAVNEPVSSMAREQGLYPLVDLVPEQIPWLFSGLVVRRGSIEAERDALMRFLKATIEGNYLALTDAKRAKEVLARETKISDPKVIDIGYEDFRQQSPLDTEPSSAGAENILAQFPASVSRNLDDYLDTSLLEALRQGGFFTTLKQKYGMH